MAEPKRSLYAYPASEEIDQGSSDEEQEVEYLDEDDTFDDEVWASRLTRRFTMHLPKDALRLFARVSNSPRMARFSGPKGSPSTPRQRHSLAIPALPLNKTSGAQPQYVDTGSPVVARASAEISSGGAGTPSLHPLRLSSTIAKPAVSPRKDSAKPTVSPRESGTLLSPRPLPTPSPRSSTNDSDTPLSPSLIPPGTPLSPRSSPRSSQSTVTPLCAISKAQITPLSPSTIESIPPGMPISPRVSSITPTSKTQHMSTPQTKQTVEKATPPLVPSDTSQMSPNTRRKLSAPSPIGTAPVNGRLRSHSSPASTPPPPPPRTAESRARQQAIVQENLRLQSLQAQQVPAATTKAANGTFVAPRPSATAAASDSQKSASLKKPLPVPPVPPKKSRHSSPESLDKAASRIQRRYRLWSAQRRYRKMVAVYRYRSHIATEILSTEQTYVATLRQIMAKYYEPIVKNTALGLETEDIKVIFGGLEVLLNVNSRLLSSLEERMNIWSPTQCLGDLFLEMAAFLKTYTEYVKNFDLALRRLAECSKIQRFETFLRTTEECDGVRTPLEALLITPVQRIPRYVLLLQQLHEHTPRTHLDYERLQNAIVQIKDVAAYINEKKRESDNALRVVEIQSLLTGKAPNIIVAQRRFCHEGELSMPDSSGKKRQKRYWFMFNDILLCTKPLTMKTIFSSKRKFKYQLFIALHGATLVDNQQHDDTSFALTTNSHTYNLCAETAELKGVWVEKLNGAIATLRTSERFHEERASKISQEKAKATKDFIMNQYSTMRVKDAYHSFPSPERKRANSVTEGPYIVAKQPPPREEEPTPDEKEFTEFLAKGGQRDKFADLLKRLVGKSSLQSPTAQSPDLTTHPLRASAPLLKCQPTEQRTSLTMLRRNSNAPPPQIALIPPTHPTLEPSTITSTSTPPSSHKQPPQRSISQPQTAQNKRLSQEETEERKRKAKSIADVAALKFMMLQELSDKCKRGEAKIRV